MKKKIAVIALMLGIALGAIGLIQQTNENKVLELGDVEIERSREHNINWMMIAGGVLLVGGIVMYIIPSSKG